MMDPDAFDLKTISTVLDIRTGAYGGIEMGVNTSLESPSVLIVAFGEGDERQAQGLTVPDEARPFFDELMAALRSVSGSRKA